MTDSYTPPKVWTWNQPNGGRFANINRPIAGADPREGAAGRQAPAAALLAGTPNGVKVTVMLEELLAPATPARIRRLAHPHRRGRQFGSGFVAINPNSKIPALLDRSGPDADARVRVRRDPALPRREVRRLPADRARRAHRNAVLAVLADGQRALTSAAASATSTPTRPTKMEYPIDRYAMEAKRQLDVLDRHLAENEYMAGDDYTIADMAIWPWYGALALGRLYDAGEFLRRAGLQHVVRWAERHRRAAGREARPHGQPHLRRAARAAPRTATTPPTSTRGPRTSAPRPSDGRPHRRGPDGPRAPAGQGGDVLPL